MPQVPTEASLQKKSLKDHFKDAFLKTGHVTEEVAEALATVAVGSLGAFQE